VIGADLDPSEVLTFWRSAGADKWFNKHDAFDCEIRTRFGALWNAALCGQLTGWEETPEDALALVIVLDQFSRNMFRGLARSYEADPLARTVADRALIRSFDRSIHGPERRFFYLPFMHSECLADQERSLVLARAYGDDDFFGHAQQHADIIRRFGRFPHRNVIVGRRTSVEEQAFLDAGGFAG
jgi:uncharacterized protein (DUF924 family)